MTVYEIKMHGTIFIRADDEATAIKAAQHFLMVTETDEDLLPEDRQMLIDVNKHEDCLVVTRSWLSELHEKAIHEFNTVSDGPSFRSGYWNGYATAIGSVLRFFSNAK